MQKIGPNLYRLLFCSAIIKKEIIHTSAITRDVFWNPNSFVINKGNPLLPKSVKQILNYWEWIQAETYLILCKMVTTKST